MSQFTKNTLYHLDPLSQCFSELDVVCVCLFCSASDLIVPVWGSACQTSSSSHTSETWTVDKHTAGFKATQLSHWMSWALLALERDFSQFVLQKFCPRTISCACAQCMIFIYFLSLKLNSENTKSTAISDTHQNNLLGDVYYYVYIYAFEMAWVTNKQYIFYYCFYFLTLKD